MASIRKRGSTFTITAYMGYDEQGKQRKKTTTFRPPDGVTAGKAEKLAKAFAANWEDKIKGYVALDENRTFADLAKWYYESVAPSVLKPNVLIDNKTMVDTYIMPTLARKKLKDISPAMLDSLFAELLRNGRIKDTYRLKEGIALPKGKWARNESLSFIARETGLSRKTVTRLSQGYGIEKRNAEKIAACLGVDFREYFESDGENRALAESSVSRVKRCLSAIFTAAVKKEIMRRNPCSNTVTIKRSRCVSSWLDEKQALQLISALDKQEDFQFKTMINTLLFTGMRGGELCGLQWQDIDLEKGIVYIRHTLAYIRSVGKPKGQGKGRTDRRKFELQTPKTAAGERYVIIPASLKGLLMEHKKRCAAWKAQRGETWNRDNMVFLTVFGNYYSEQYLNAKFKAFARRIGLPDNIHIHSLRHTTASLLINSDISPKLIAEQLGHASASITQDIYSHIFQSSKARAAQALDIALSPIGM